MTDPNFLADAAKARQPIDPVFGADAENILQKLYAAPAEIVAAAKEVGSEKINLTLRWICSVAAARWIIRWPRNLPLARASRLSARLLSAHPTIATIMSTATIIAGAFTSTVSDRHHRLTTPSCPFVSRQSRNCYAS